MSLQRGSGRFLRRSTSAITTTLPCIYRHHPAPPRAVSSRLSRSCFLHTTRPLTRCQLAAAAARSPSASLQQQQPRFTQTRQLVTISNNLLESLKKHEIIPDGKDFRHVVGMEQIGFTCCCLVSDLLTLRDSA